ncbi:DUF1499 domain-containing protein [Chelativorans sp. Marseille-P2723]|uniref:DUF1499 domain-containing protein n=1 Tax=Chelativorans sp. Marseille-P2723 TaxID=2709133 RepID=UPI00156DDD7E|nr:DUF1499 domain-containing protein [Chelativorans sp. Marseille-P2723]
MRSNRYNNSFIGRVMFAGSIRRFSATAQGSHRLGAFTLVLFLTSALSHRFGLIDTLPFLVLLGLCLSLALCSLCMAVSGAVEIWRRDLSGAGSVAMGLVFSLLALTPYAAAGYRYVVYPQLNDISTDLNRPPQLLRAATFRRLPMAPLHAFNREAATIQAKAYPLLTGRRYDHTREAVVEAATELAESRGWTALAPMPSAGISGSVTLEAVAGSYLLGLPSDIAIRIEEHEDAVHVEMRSVSRYGRHDLGDNFLRVQRFLDDLDRRLESLVP